MLSNNILPIFVHHAGGGPAFTLGGKLEPPKTSASDAPDPGAYGIPDDGAGKGPAFSLGGKRREQDPALHLQVGYGTTFQRVYATLACCLLERNV
jgi:hypothetical protein